MFVLAFRKRKKRSLSKKNLEPASRASPLSLPGPSPFFPPADTQPRQSSRTRIQPNCPPHRSSLPRSPLFFFSSLCPAGPTRQEDHLQPPTVPRVLPAREILLLIAAFKAMISYHITLYKKPRSSSPFSPASSLRSCPQAREIARRSPPFRRRPTPIPAKV